MICKPKHALTRGAYKAAALTVALGLVGASASHAQRPKPEMRPLAGDTLYTVLKPGAIPAIFKPEFVSATRAKTLYYDEEPMMVVRAGDEVKAYSIWHLDGHEIVNDHIGGAAIAVTW